jgi:ribonuclease R
MGAIHAIHICTTFIENKYSKMSRGKKKKDKHKAGGTSKTFTGKLDVNRSGMGFVVVEGLEKDIVVKRGDMDNAMHGDTVQVVVQHYSEKNNRNEGVVTAVVERKQTEFTGTVQMNGTFAFLIPDNKKINTDIYIPQGAVNGAKDGDHANVKITDWSAKGKNPVGTITHILTGASRNEVAMQSILSENGFPLAFPPEVLQESEAIDGSITDDEVAKRRDYRNSLVMTIDPADAKDFDDAVSIIKTRGELYEVGVHIADVSHFIKPGSALDAEAYKRATSVYLPDRVLPMLPDRLSNGVCSLRPGEDKYTFSAVFLINKQGHITDKWIGRTIINSKRRYAYEEVQEIIETGKGDNCEEILTLNEMAQNLRSARFKKGAINFSSQEVRFKLDEAGKPIGIIIKESKESHQLIEELMLLANRTVAEYVGAQMNNDKPVPFPYRVHDVPNEEKLNVFTLFARRFGVKFNLSSPENIAKSFNEMLATVHGKPEQHVLEQLGIRTMSKAVYTTDNIGHYGLGFENYCHFTSPIRRYPDVLVHRILQQCLDNEVRPIAHLETMCRHCSDQERRAMEAERTGNKYKQVEYMVDLVGEEFDGVISGVSTFGFWVETVEQKCEGMVSITDLSEYDTFVFLEADYALAGLRTRLRFAMGDSVKVQLIAANLERRQLDFCVVGMPVARAAKRDKNKRKMQ